jgi:hypothetical protein
MRYAHSTICTFPVSTSYANPTICVPDLMKGDSLNAATSSRTLSSILGSRKGKVSIFACVVENCMCTETYEPLISPKLMAEICAFSEGAILRRESRIAWSGKWVMPQSGG